MRAASRFTPMKRSRNYYVVIGLVAASLALSTLPAEKIRPVKNGVMPAMTWLRSAAASLSDGFVAMLPTSSRRTGVGNNDREPELRREILALQDEIIRLRTLNRNLGDTRAVESEFGAFHFTPLPAEVIVRRDVSQIARTLVIGAGRDQGVGEGMAVVRGRAVIGVVHQAGRNHSMVRLVTDPQFRAAGMGIHTRLQGVIRGNGNGLQLAFIPSAETMEVGETIVTAGTDGIFPRGFQFGVARKIEDRDFNKEWDIEVEPAMPFSQIEDVAVLLPRSR